MITLRPSRDWSGDGVLRGTIVAYDDAGESLWESRGTWSDQAFRRRQAADLAATVDITEDRARALLTAALREARKAADASTAAREAAVPIPTRPVVNVTGQHLRDLSDAGWELVVSEIEPERRLYALGGAVVDLVRRDGRLRPRPLGRDGLRYHLARLGDWQREGRGGPLPVPPPRDVTEDMLIYPAPPVLPLSGIAYSPIVTPDGEIVTSSGYHPSSGYFVDLGRLAMPPVSPAPTAEDVTNARRLLVTELFGDFRFAGEADRTHAVAAILCPVIRPLIGGPTPLHMIEAPTPGSGKGLLADTIAEVTTGGPPRSMTEGHDDDEWRRRITAALVDAQPVTLLDNARRRIDSGSLSSALTVREWSDRLLGGSRIVTVPVRTTWFVTANNPACSEEIARRIVRIRIDTGEERPWERSGWRHDPLLAWVRQERDLLLWAILTLVSAWLAAGRPRGRYTMGSYEEWAVTVGGILDVAGLPGFLSNRQETYRQAEADSEAWRELVAAWRQSYRGQRVGVDKLFDLARDRKLLTELRTGRTDRGARTAMGSWLASITDRVIAGYRIRRDGETETGGAAYRLELVPENEQQPAQPNAEVLEGSEGSAKDGAIPEPPEPSELQRYAEPAQRALVNAAAADELARVLASLDAVYGPAPEGPQ